MYPTGTVIGTMIHGLFENEALRVGLLTALRKRKRISESGGRSFIPPQEAEFDRLANFVRDNLDMQSIEKLAGLSVAGTR